MLGTQKRDQARATLFLLVFLPSAEMKKNFFFSAVFAGKMHR